ncbi:hypothetical protein MY11210_002406 [Beauveria gryllotalpidicola]
MDAVVEQHPPLSAAKQDRILIWRREVASASLDPDTTHDGASSSATSTTTSSASSSSSSSSRAALAAGRRVLAKLAHKLSKRSLSLRRGSPADDGSCGGRGVTRTAMYATLSPDYRPGELHLGDDDDDDDGSFPQGLIRRAS